MKIREDETLKEKLYTIPVTDAFEKSGECPLCSAWRDLEADSISYTMGPSYMEDDIREETNKTGFCQNHLKLMYKNQNRLGLTLIMSTHMEHTIKEIEKLSKNGPQGKGLFKKSSLSGVKEYIDKLDQSCFVCNRINATFERYIATILYLYKSEPDFKKTFKSCNGFCTKHYGELYESAANNLHGKTQDEFLADLNELYLTNMKRVLEDLEWFRDKFDYRNADAPWKNSQDALPRTLLKTDSVILEES